MKPLHHSSARVVASGWLGLALFGSAGAAPIEVRKNDVIPIRFDDQLSTSDSRPGDLFTATPENASAFPKGTQFEGHVAQVAQKTRRHPASMDLVFDDVKFPDGARRAIEGVPVPLSSKYVEKDRDGHYVATGAVPKETAVGVGAVAGFIIGAIFHRPFEGTFIGTLAGILVADTAGDDRVLVINRGSEAGVLFQHTVRFDKVSAGVTPDVHDAPPLPSTSESPPPITSARLTARIGDRTVQYPGETAPFKAGEILMVPIKFTAKELGLSYDESDTSIFVENDNHSLRFEQNSASYRVDGQSATLASGVVQRNGVWYAPAGAFEATVGKQ